MIDLINECNYKQVSRNPLKKMVRESDQMRQQIKKVFGDRVCRNLIVSNPVLPKLYALPKTHKPGKKMRPIVSNVNAPTYKIAKWLVKELNKLPRIKSRSVKNSFEFIEKIKDILIAIDEIMISFDVSSLFPSIPVDIALNELKKHLDNCNIEQNKKRHIFSRCKTMYGTKFLRISRKNLQSGIWNKYGQST